MKISLTKVLKEARPPMYGPANDSLLHIDDIDYKIASVITSIHMNPECVFYNYTLEMIGDNVRNTWRRKITEDELSRLIRTGRAKVYKGGTV